MPPSRNGYAGPYRFNHAERPCSLQKTICAGKRARPGEGQDEPRASIFQRVKDEHQRNGDEPKRRQQVHPGCSQHTEREGLSRLASALGLLALLFGALLRLGAGFRLLRVVPLGALGEPARIEEAQHAIGRLSPN